MSVVVIREDTGQFLDQKRGRCRGWTDRLDKAQVFETAGQGKVAYNHATAHDRYWNGWSERHPDRNGRIVAIPPFATREVQVGIVLV